MNASTPDQMTLLRQALGAYRSALRSGEPESQQMIELANAALEPVRVEEPAGDPTNEEVLAWAAENGHTYAALEDGKVPERVLSTLREGKTLRDLYNEAHAPERVAQSANADVRVGLHECATCSRCSTTYAIVHPVCPKCAALPVPVGDETEALRAALDKLYWAARGVGKDAAEVAFEAVSARVAGLEAREARLILERDVAREAHDNALEQYTKAEAREASLRDALEKTVDESVERWHETCPAEERSLHEWLGLTWDDYADFVQHGVDAYVAALTRAKPADSGEAGS